MAMVRQSPASQASSRPSWPAAPTSSTPPETDDPVSHTNSGNLHGAIGEHRRSSRSSSVSSGGSSTNSGEGLDSTRQQAQSRLSLSTSQPHPPSQEAALDQPGSHVLQPSAHGNGQSSEAKDSTEAMVGKDGKQAQAGSDAEQKGSIGSAGAGHQSFDASHFSHFMGGQPNLDEAGFQDMPKQGRPITGPNNASSTFPSTSMPQGAEVDLCRLLGETFSPSQFTNSLQQDLNQMGLPTAFFDNYNAGGASQAPASSDTDFGPVGGFSQSSPNMQFGGSNFGGGAYQSSFMPQGNQFSSSFYSGNGGMTNRSSNFYSPQPGFNTNYYNPNRPGNDYFVTSSGNLQGFSSQDFSLPPPTQPWRGGPYSPNIPENILKKITCEACNKQYKWPHALECLHVFCFPCVCSKFNPAEKCVTCPKCNRKTPVKDGEGPCGLPLDYQGARFMREVKIFPFTCTSCTRDQEAVTCCTTCMAFLCAECRDGHRSILQFQGHNLCPITKIGKGEDGDYTPFCEKHVTEALTKYCCVCEYMICPICIVDHVHPEFPNKENNHHDLKEVHPIVVERLKTWNEDASIKHKDVLEMSKLVPFILQTIDNKRRGCRKQIDEYSDYCKTVVDQNRMAAYEMLDKTAAQVESQVMAWSKTISAMEKQLEAVVSFNIRTVQQASVPETLKLLALMENEYKRCVEQYSNVVKDNESIKVDLKFDPNYKESHTILNQNFTSISYTINGLEQKVSPSTGGQRGDLSRGRSFSDYSMSNSDNPDCNYQRWSAAPDSMSISTWNNVSERDRKNGTFIPHLNRCRTKTSYIHMFGEYGRGEYAFTEPSGQAYLKDGSYVICDTNNHRIVYYNAKHEYVRTIGQPPNLPPVAEEQEQRNNGPRGKGFARQDGYLYFPNRVAICPITQNIVATERPPSHDVQIFTVEGEFVRCFGGNILQHPRGVTVDEEGIIIVVECKVMKLVMFNQDGSFIVSHSLTKDLEFPNDVAAKDGKIFISDNRGHCVQVFNYNAEFIYKIGNESITYFPIGVSINFLNQVVVTDNHNTFNITVFDISGQVLHIFESVSKLAQCHNVAVHPHNLELMLTTKDCSVYFFNYDPAVAHPLTPPVSRGSGSGTSIARRPRGNGNGSVSGASFY